MGDAIKSWVAAKPKNASKATAPVPKTAPKRSTRKLLFHNKIQQSDINIIRLRASGGRSNRSTKEIIIIGFREVTQFGIILRHGNK